MNHSAQYCRKQVYIFPFDFNFLLSVLNLFSCWGSAEPLWGMVFNLLILSFAGAQQQTESEDSACELIKHHMSSVIIHYNYLTFTNMSSGD